VNVQWLTERDEVVAEVNVDDTIWKIAKDGWENVDLIVSPIIWATCHVTKVRLVTLDKVLINKCRLKRALNVSAGDRVAIKPGHIRVDMHAYDEATGMALT
jgi:hypothetical protein